MFTCSNTFMYIGNNKIKGVKNMFNPDAIYYEPDIKNYILGNELLEKYKDLPKIKIENPIDVRT